VLSASQKSGTRLELMGGIGHTRHKDTGGRTEVEEDQSGSQLRLSCVGPESSYPNLKWKSQVGRPYRAAGVDGSSVRPEILQPYELGATVRDERAFGPLVHRGAEVREVVLGGIPQVLGRIADLGEQVVHRERGFPGEHVLA